MNEIELSNYKILHKYKTLGVFSVNKRTWNRHLCVLVVQSCLTLVTQWTVTHQTPLSVDFSTLEYWSGLSFPSPGDLPDPESELRSPALQADSLPSEPQILIVCLTHYEKGSINSYTNWEFKYSVNEWVINISCLLCGLTVIGTKETHKFIILLCLQLRIGNTYVSILWTLKHHISVTIDFLSWYA